MDGWVAWWMDGWMGECMDGWVDGYSKGLPPTAWTQGVKDIVENVTARNGLQ
jgi:hypothetical protein